ncbi:hypothetical protein COLSTE_01482 [Collinsella stercoris DSM 13279]|uniref:Uncharacterized protein n=1 Tax=Collinsella stercoris DSM 13279 TaxID=445975 RepID=B6GBL9_9ACTN|nr:hypothetical protein COLSTE_01482 [Collinsella stercoris DSM 13279]
MNTLEGFSRAAVRVPLMTQKGRRPCGRRPFSCRVFRRAT